MRNQDCDPVEVGKAIDAIEVKVACAFSIAMLLALRAELLGLIGQLPRPSFLLTRAIELRKRTEIIVGQMLLSQRERGLRPGGGKRKNRTTIESQGIKKSLGIKWQRRAAAAYAADRAFTVRAIETADIAAALPLLNEATAELRAAADDQSRAVALARTILAERFVGAFIQQDQGRGFSNNRRAAMKRLARMSEEQYIAYIFAEIELAKPVRQIIGEWTSGADGVLTRYVGAA